MRMGRSGAWLREGVAVGIKVVRRAAVGVVEVVGVVWFLGRSGEGAVLMMGLVGLTERRYGRHTLRLCLMSPP